MEKIVDGILISNEVKEEIKKSIKFEMIKPSIAVIQIGDNLASDNHLKQLQIVCDDVGVYFRHYKYDDGVSELTVINKIKELNNDDYVNGIIVELPLPDGYNEKRLVNTIINSKDVDGLTDINVGRLIGGRKTLLPSTSLAVMEILKRNEIELAGKNVVLVGRGKLTCKPLIQLLLNEDATVTICHSKTENLKDYTKKADIIITATGVNNLITDEMVKDGIIVIDIGINYEDGKISGDVDFDSIRKKATLITNVPGGIGPIAIVMLLKNVVYCYLNKKK